MADFGLAETIDLDEHTHLSTSVSGTIGYLAPEYTTQGKLTTKSDVYAFGVVILQVRGMGGERVWYLKMCVRHMRIYIHICVHIYIHIHTYTYTLIYSQIHTLIDKDNHIPSI